MTLHNDYQLGGGHDFLETTGAGPPAKDGPKGVAALPKVSSDDLTFWSSQYMPVLSSLLRHAGSYTSEQQKSHLRFIEKHVLPSVGPRPENPDGVYMVSHFGTSTYEASINLSDKGAPCVRFTFEPPGPQDYGTLESPYQPVSAIAEAIEADMEWFNKIAAVFFLDNSECEAVRPMLPPSVARIPQYLLAFDFNGSKRKMKAYFCPALKQMSTGLDPDTATLDLVRSLGPDLADSLKAIGEWKSRCAEPLAIQMIGLDCLAPENGARIKLYTRTESNAFHNIRDHVTLGGQKTDETTLAGLKVLAEIWHLLLDEPSGIADPSVSKPVNDETNIWHKAIIYSWELAPGKKLPEVKVYVPLWQYSRSNRAIVNNLEEVFKRLDWSWGTEGTYKKTILDTFGDDVMADGKPMVFTHLSFNFSNKGKYISSYVLPPCFRP
ncbi:aromatic prenyltransferase [Xylariaceae sp. FL1019]|nr:aromatic prenyltransferase [Xylariaceae sp. FL1019]